MPQPLSANKIALVTAIVTAPKAHALRDHVRAPAEQGAGVPASRIHCEFRSPADEPLAD